MCYIPKEWIRNKDNEKEIWGILDFLSQDFVSDEIISQKETLTEKLKSIGEDIIYNKIKQSDLSTLQERWLTDQENYKKGAKAVIYRCDDCSHKGTENKCSVFGCIPNKIENMEQTCIKYEGSTTMI